MLTYADLISVSDPRHFRYFTLLLYFTYHPYTRTLIKLHWSIREVADGIHTPDTLWHLPYASPNTHTHTHTPIHTNTIQHDPEGKTVEEELLEFESFHDYLARNSAE